MLRILFAALALLSAAVHAKDWAVDPAASTLGFGGTYQGEKGSKYEGMIGVNEMLAFKLPMNLYQMYMREAHYDAPMAEQEKLIANLDLMKGQAVQTSGRSTDEEEGYEEVRNKVAAPEMFS